MNVQARWASDTNPTPWTDYGDVSHAVAAKRHATFFNRGGEVETRWEGNDNTVNRITVEAEMVFRVKCHRPPEPERDQ